MRVVASAQVAEAVRQAGGRLFVWPEQGKCCGRAAIRLATGPAPKDGVEFERVPVDGFELHLARIGRVPEELHLDVHGRKRQRVAAYWDGCAWLM
jgi:hypothetical protein